MRDKHIKTWLFVFVGTLMVASSAASFFAQQKTLYKGLEPLGKNFAQASVFTAADEIQPAQPAFFPQTETKKSDEPSPKQTAAGEETPAEPFFEPVASPCGASEKPIIKNSQITGCSTISTNYKLQTINFNPPALKIKILEANTCESQGRFTYTGEDQPGLLYGMCIDCLTTQFAANGGKCKK